MSESEEELTIPEKRAQVFASGLTVQTGAHVGDITLEAPMTLLYTGRESSATTTMMTLAGRMKPKAGVVKLVTANGAVVEKPRSRAKLIALAGVNEIDSLDRNVTVASLVRESAAWSNRWWERTPHDIAKIDRWNELQELLQFDGSPRAHAGDLTPQQRFTLRVLLALMTRKQPEMLFVDDIDQVHSLEIRREIICNLKDVSSLLPVVVASSNRDVDGIVDATVELRPTGKDA
ncbi:hypothetical protein QVA66_00955 [Staphylococcus chromogenes]|nr:hypothetical protein [Staphylococcus chromogenes]